MSAEDEPTLPEGDLDLLQEKGYDYKLVAHPGGTYLIINSFDLGPAYQPTVATVLINVVTGYPESALDMFFTKPDVKLVNGNWPHAAEGRPIHNNETWQQWSRHYVWRSGVDNLRTFITAIKKEIAKGI